MTRALRAEWVKLRTVRSTGLALIATFVLALLMTVVSASGSHFGYDGPEAFDSGTFVHRTATGDGTFTVRVADQKDSENWAKAGLMLRGSTEGGAAYATILLTPGHGVRMFVDGTNEKTADVSGATRWLRLTRDGDRITGYQSADGRGWHEVATLTASRLPARTEAGLFVTSPPRSVERRIGPGAAAVHPVATTGRAVFDHVAFPGTADGAWRQTDIVQKYAHGGMRTPTTEPQPYTRADGRLTVTGSGDLGALGTAGVGLEPAPPDQVKETLETGTRLAAIAVIALGVLSVTSEYRTGTVRTTFTASPRRGRVLAAKAVVLAAVVFVVGLAASVASPYVARPYQRENGFRPPLFPDVSLTDPATLRAVVGSAAYLALIAVLSMGVGVLLRRTVPAVVLMLTLVIVVPIVGSSTSIAFSDFVEGATPTAGLAIQQTRQLIEYAVAPWTGFAVLCAYVAVVLGAAGWRLARRDV
ncbi:ABC transporter permease subunit [Streptomyces sp. NPDC050400]|uniref:ABC transporter permease subunit n=1 Tax=Streptomyces sp. NPDC050400 TaxID=3365610 RepID=UPI0037B58831